jgi:hypothetical protein
MFMKWFYIFTLFPFLLTPQSEFFDNAALGIKTDFVTSLNSDFSGIGGGIGISILNSADIGFEYINTSYHQVESHSRMAYAAYNFRSAKTCLKVLLGYSHSSSSAFEINYYLPDVKGPLLGVIVSPEIYENNSLRLLPGFKFSMAFLSSSSKPDDGSSHDISFGLEFNVIPKLNRMFAFVLAPSVAFSLSDSDPVIYGFNLGLLFNIQKE